MSKISSPSPPKSVTVRRQDCAYCRKSWYPRVSEKGEVNQPAKCHHCGNANYRRGRVKAPYQTKKRRENLSEISG